jgi:hypothetical protein
VLGWALHSGGCEKGNVRRVKHVSKKYKTYHSSTMFEGDVRQSPVAVVVVVVVVAVV